MGEKTFPSDQRSMTLTDVGGLLVGHATDYENQTGCTAVLCPEGATAGVSVAGFAVGASELELLNPLARADVIHGLLLTGGSAFGLAAASGVVRWLAEHGYGLPTVFSRVPLVPAAVIYDLNFNQTRSKPDAAMGYQAAAAATAGPVAMGCVGVGAGATCGKLAGFERAMKSGLGSAGAVINLPDGQVTVAALAVVNPVGFILDPQTGWAIAGARQPDGHGLADPLEILLAIQNLIPGQPTHNTTLAVVATDAALDRIQATRAARMAATALARTIKPIHTIYDGDLVFCLATSRGPAADENIIGTIGAEVLAQAIIAGVKSATSVPGFPAWADLDPRP